MLIDTEGWTKATQHQINLHRAVFFHMTAGPHVTSKFPLSHLIKNTVVHNPEVVASQPGGVNVLQSLRCAKNLRDYRFVTALCCCLLCLFREKPTVKTTSWRAAVTVKPNMSLSGSRVYAACTMTPCFAALFPPLLPFPHSPSSLFLILNNKNLAGVLGKLYENEWIHFENGHCKFKK